MESGKEDRRLHAYSECQTENQEIKVVSTHLPNLHKILDNKSVSRKI